MGGFTKLFSSILTSSIWLEDDATVRVWITLLALADADGIVEISIPSLAYIARKPIDVTESAISKFLRPDPHSRSTDHEGRRIEPIPGGWKLLNHAGYRGKRDPEERREQTREATARWRSRLRDSEPAVSIGEPSEPPRAQAEAEAEAEAITTLSGKPDDIRSENKKLKAQAVEVLTFLNESTGRRYRETPVNLGMIVARLKTGASVQDCKTIIARKRREWGADEKMAIYLRPATLFNASKFEQYLGECVPK